jgi:predicted O-methyltransferase YrrM
MDPVAERLLRTRKVVDNDGNELPLHSFTPMEQGEYLQSLVRATSARVTLEVGFAYGISTLFICEALKHQGALRHYVIDPYQHDWKNIGIRNVDEAGYANLVEFFPEQSYEVLPRLLRDGVKIDFAYIDTTKVFDHVLVDCFFVFRLLRAGGLFVLDDCTFPGLRKLARMLSQDPAIRVHSSFGAAPSRRSLRIGGKILGRLPKSRQVFSSRLIATDEELGVNAHCIAFEKVSDDNRNWDWFCDF